MLQHLCSIQLQPPLKEKMPISRLTVSAPSSALLKFLKSQSENLCFFTSNAKPGLGHRHTAQGFTDLSSRQARNHAFSRSLSTTLRRHATVEASLLNFDFLWPPSKLKNPRPSPSTSVAQSSLYLYGSQAKHTLRYTSTSNQPWLRRLWELKRRSGQTALKPDDLPSLTGFLDEGAETSMFNLGRSLAGKASNELKLRCTEFDENGNVTLVNGEFKKSELIAKVHIAPVIFRTPWCSRRSDRSMVSSRATSARSTRPFFRTSLSALQPSSSTFSTFAS